jgi:putative membrane protein
MHLTEILPHVNAALNAIAAIFLSAGYYFVRQRDFARHRACMVTAAAVSAVFLIPGQGPVRYFYYTLLISHVTLSVAIVPLVALTLWRALKGRFELHRKVARWAWPAWMYVSITGILVYVMLYQVYKA